MSADNETRARKWLSISKGLFDPISNSVEHVVASLTALLDAVAQEAIKARDAAIRERCGHSCTPTEIGCVVCARSEAGAIAVETIADAGENGYERGRDGEGARVLALVQEIAEHFPKDIFREPPPGEHGQSVDACSARGVRHGLQLVRRAIEGKGGEGG